MGTYVRANDARRHRRAVQAGLTVPAIARQLDLAPTTVSYHVERLAADDDRHQTPEDAPPDGVVSEVSTRRRVASLLAEGTPRAEIARRLGISKPTVSYHARPLGEIVDERCARRYDWEAVQRYYDAGHSVRECIQSFGFSAASWFDAVNRGALVARPSATPISDLLVAGTYRGRHNLKARLVREGVKRNICERCGAIDWLGEPLTLALHHVNGQRNDNRLENLMPLMPELPQPDRQLRRQERTSEKARCERNLIIGERSAKSRARAGYLSANRCATLLP